MQRCKALCRGHARRWCWGASLVLAEAWAWTAAAGNQRAIIEGRARGDGVGKAKQDAERVLIQLQQSRLEESKRRRDG
ncbi:hypothetical protein BM1_06527 [Bipolaris maydis]|nr:hypothetical protein BM1_06527 [Bipolaris maydis]